jgi:hypothetical protein
VEWELDSDMAWAKVERMTRTARTVMWEGSRSGRVSVLLVLAGESWSLCHLLLFETYPFT